MIFELIKIYILMISKVCLLTITSALASFADNLRERIENSPEDFNETTLFDDFVLGEMENYLSWR